MIARYSPLNRARVVIALALLFALVACTDATLKAVAQAELDVANGVGAATKTTEALYAQQQISAADAQAVVTVLQQITVANTQAAAITRNVSTLTPAQRSTLHDIIVPVVNALNQAIATSTISIKDPTAKAILTASLSALATTLTIIQSRTGQ